MLFYYYNYDSTSLILFLPPLRGGRESIDRSEGRSIEVMGPKVSTKIYIPATLLSSGAPERLKGVRSVTEIKRCLNYVFLSTI